MNIKDISLNLMSNKSIKILYKSEMCQINFKIIYVTFPEPFKLTCRISTVIQSKSKNNLIVYFINQLTLISNANTMATGWLPK